MPKGRGAIDYIRPLFHLMFDCYIHPVQLSCRAQEVGFRTRVLYKFFRVVIRLNLSASVLLQFDP
jgi:hypothetical protein